jgi:hypothetical protein
MYQIKKKQKKKKKMKQKNNWEIKNNSGFNIRDKIIK